MSKRDPVQLIERAMKLVADGNRAAAIDELREARSALLDREGDDLHATLRSAVENLRSADKDERRVEAAWRIANRIETALNRAEPLPRPDAARAVLYEAEDLLREAHYAHVKMGLWGQGGAALSHEVRMFALHFSPDAVKEQPGGRTVTGDGRWDKWCESLSALLEKLPEARPGTLPDCALPHGIDPCEGWRAEHDLRLRAEEAARARSRSIAERFAKVIPKTMGQRDEDGRVRWLYMVNWVVSVLKSEDESFDAGKFYEKIGIDTTFPEATR
jgi:hypothetical protein